MKPLLLNTFYVSGGAARATCRLHEGLVSLGSDAHLLVQNDFAGTARSVHGPVGAWEKAGAFLKLRGDGLPLYLYPKRDRHLFSLNFLPDLAGSRIRALDPDVVNLHWVNGGFLRIESLRKLNKPVVWTLHDSWPFTGGCHLPMDCRRYGASCGRCPALGSERDLDLSRWVWRRKSRALTGVDLTVVTPSRWLARCAAESSLLGGCRIEVIPNGLDLSRFHPVARDEARSLLGLPAHKKLILFGAVGGTTDPNKGFHLLVPALKEVAAAGFGAECEAVVFGVAEPAKAPDLGMKATYVGYLHDEERLKHLYSAADVFVAPSLQENLPCTIMEAMACGTPCVAFNVGGIPDLIDHGDNGFLAQPYRPASLAEGIVRALQEDGNRALSCAARLKVERCFSIERCARRYLELYRELVG